MCVYVCIFFSSFYTYLFFFHYSFRPLFLAIPWSFFFFNQMLGYIIIISFFLPIILFSNSLFLFFFLCLYTCARVRFLFKCFTTTSYRCYPHLSLLLRGFMSFRGRSDALISVKAQYIYTYIYIYICTRTCIQTETEKSTSKKRQPSKQLYSVLLYGFQYTLQEMNRWTRKTCAKRIFSW